MKLLLIFFQHSRLPLRPFHKKGSFFDTSHFVCIITLLLCTFGTTANAKKAKRTQYNCCFLAS